ncbi:MAG: hypothetical protein J6A94_07415 [Lachnospiraceae bacterium]|nr:hypothetical protein [Lachnospiraceae bacterium]
MKMKKKSVIWIMSAVLLAVSVVILYVTHRAVPFMMDDLWYSTMLSSEEPITSLGDIIQSQIWHYHNWGGRSVTHTILQLTLLAGEQVADICNVLATLLLAGIICVLAGHKSVPAFFAAFGMLLGLNANWKMSMFWQAGAANYLYITSFLLWYLYCYLRELSRGTGEEKELPGILFWSIPLGLIAGWSNENMGPAVWIISAIVMYIQWQKTGRIKAWMVLGNISCLIGSALVILAPGNFVRSAEAASNEYGLLWNLFLRTYSEAQSALIFLFPALLLLAGILIIGKGVLGIGVSIENKLLLFCALLSWGAMVLSPHYPDRATFGTMVLIICVVLSLARDILKERKDLSPWLWGVTLLIWLRGMYYLGEFLALSWGWIR